MNCCKYILRNESNSTANFNFKKCDDKLWYKEYVIEPYQTLEVWLEINSFSTEFESVKIIFQNCNYPEGNVSPTRFNTPTVTPTHSITPTFTPTPNFTPTPTITPSFTPTPTTPPENLKMTFDSFFSDVSFYVQNLASVNLEMVVDWGDGTPVEIFLNEDNYTTYHTYNDIGVFTANVFFTDRTKVVNFSLQNSTLIDIKGLEGFPSLITLFLNQNRLPNFTPQHPLSSFLELINLDENSISVFDPLYPLSSHLTQLELKNNFITNFNPTQQLPSALDYLDLRGNQITTFNPTLPLPSGLTQLFLSSNPLTGFTPTQTITNNLEFLYLDNCSLETTEIQNTLDYLDAITWNSPNSIYLNNQSTLGCIQIDYPAYQNLVSEGWNIVADLCSLDLYFDNIAYADILVGGDSSDITDWNNYFDLPTYGTPFSSVTVSGNTVSLFGGGNITIKDNLFSDYIHLLKFIDNGGVIKVVGNTSFGGNTGVSALSEIYSLGIETALNKSFHKCVNLTSVDLPALKYVGDETFSYCSLVPSFYLPSLISGGTFVFERCLSATTFNLPSITGSGSWFFHFCTSATNFYIPSMLDLGGSVSDNGVFDTINSLGSQVTLTVPIALMTCDSGFPDGDIVYLTDNYPTTVITV